MAISVNILKELGLELSGNIHIAVMSAPFLQYMLEGKKTIESRFSKNKIAPYQNIESGDIVLLKKSAGPVVAHFRAGKVESVELNETNLEDYKLRYDSGVCGGEEFWKAQRGKRYATFIEVQQLQRVEPRVIEKKDRRGWVVISRATSKYD